MKTRAMHLLDKAGVSYTVREFQKEELGAEEVAEKLGIPLDQVCKTLVVRGDRTGVVLACLPATTLSLKSLARVSNNKQVALVETADILRLTGYIRGGVSPLGGKKAYPVYPPPPGTAIRRPLRRWSGAIRTGVRLRDAYVPERRGRHGECAAPGKAPRRQDQCEPERSDGRRGFTCRSR
jgi:Cys-tRNA(Pro)/Cys-tRNA(Cys) deacylase